MSAIVAGKACRVCRKEYWLSFGHPPWMNRKGHQTFEAFEALRTSGMCPMCWLGWVGDLAQQAEKEGNPTKYDHLMPFAFVVLNMIHGDK